MGQRTGLCIGINDYPGTGSDLQGCVNDAHDWAAVLDGRGFAVTSMLDGDATRQNMVEAIGNVVGSADQGDSVVITYSGHGTWLPDQDADETDMRDEALCPHDLATAGPITDDELFELFSRRQRDVRVVLISDSCHSGTVARFAPGIDDAQPKVKFLPPEIFLPQDRMPIARRASAAPPAGRSRTSALVFAGCRDVEYSYDATFGGRPNGAFTHAALESLQQLGTDASYRDWLTKVREHLPSANFPQTPRLDGASSQRRWQVLT